MAIVNLMNGQSETKNGAQAKADAVKTWATTELGKKANQTEVTPLRFDILSPAEINDFDNFPVGCYRADGSFLNGPGTYFNGQVVTRHYLALKTQTAIEYQSDNAVYYRTCGGSPEVWSKWRNLADIKPTPETNIPLAEGIAPMGYTRYRKNNFGEVNGSFGIMRNPGLVKDEVICTLPEGFHPGHQVETPALCITSEWEYCAGAIVIMQDGTIKLDCTKTAAFIYAWFSFVGH